MATPPGWAGLHVHISWSTPEHACLKRSLLKPPASTEQKRCCLQVCPPRSVAVDVVALLADPHAVLTGRPHAQPQQRCLLMAVATAGQFPSRLLVMQESRTSQPPSQRYSAWWGARSRQSSCYGFLGYVAADPITRDQLAYARIIIKEAQRLLG